LKKGNLAQSKQNLRTAGLKESRFFGYDIITTVKLIVGSVVILIRYVQFPLSPFSEKMPVFAVWSTHVQPNVNALNILFYFNRELRFGPNTRKT